MIWLCDDWSIFRTSLEIYAQKRFSFQGLFILSNFIDNHYQVGEAWIYAYTHTRTFPQSTNSSKYDTGYWLIWARRLSLHEQRETYLTLYVCYHRCFRRWLNEQWDCGKIRTKASRSIAPKFPKYSCRNHLKRNVNE